MTYAILSHWKIELAIVIVGAGLMANEVTSPKMLATMVFLADWHMLWTLEWWVRMIIGLAFGVGLWLLERRKHKKQLVILQSELRQAEILITTMRTRIHVLEGAR